ncbi:putative membrane protein [Ehrlichia japonica]|uniref:Putative membrane protein n=1 Tax=Ehrlichia japonica TaxID=391036 RepID=X5GKB6_9RICK|nr:putative membrane protein [Ehrlichia japonica]
MSGSYGWGFLICFYIRVSSVPYGIDYMANEWVVNYLRVTFCLYKVFILLMENDEFYKS